MKLQDFKKQPLNKEKLLFPNFYDDSLLLETAGIGFSEEESFKIQVSVRKLADQINAKSMRFWGKYLTRGKDYYVAQGLYSNDNCDKLPNHCEQKGIGANKYTFWVTHNVLEEWTELPLITPDHIVQARQIKYFFTGDLNANVKTYPTFSGKEKHFLKAQLVRITFGSELVPKGLYRATEEGEEGYPDLQLEDQFEFPEYPDLSEPTSWVHLHPALQKQGRISIYVDPKLSEQEQQDKLAEIEENDEDTKVEKLRDISTDKSPFAKPDSEDAEEEINWQKREYGDKQQFTSLNGEKTLNYNCVCFKNLTWPGACLVANVNNTHVLLNNTISSYCNIYVGYGFKQNQHPFLPVQPTDLLTEQEDTDEKPENQFFVIINQPNPDNPPDEVESDSDEEKNDENDDS